MNNKKAADSITPIYLRLAHDYKEIIIRGELLAGDRIDSIAQIQVRHSVSRETAKAVLKVLSDEGFIVQYAGKGSYVSEIRPLKKTWGIILPFYSIVYEDLLHQMTMLATGHGREIEHFMSYNQWQEETRLVEQMVSERFEVVVVVPTVDESKASEFYRKLAHPKTLVALMDHTMSGSFFSYVIQSYEVGVSRGLERLLARGKGTIAFVRNEIWAGRNLLQENMEATFIAIMEMERPGEEPVIAGRIADIDKRLIRKRNISGFFCCDDTDAIRLIGRLREQGIRVPEDISLVSYGNTDLARYFSPAISSIDGHTEEMARTMVDIISKGLNGEDIRFSQYVIQPDLVERET